MDYARSFFPVAAVVLILRAFIFEPFRIPSDSMMPTLLSGDFIIVNKYAYGLRLPVLNTQVRLHRRAGARRRGGVPLSAGSEHQLHQAPGRPAGRPGGREGRPHLRERQARPVRRDAAASTTAATSTCSEAAEHLGDHVHRTIFCPGPIESPPLALPSCTRRTMTGYICSDRRTPGYGELEGEPESQVMVVPAGEYLMIGDNRDNSEDGRKWGFVPENNLVGKATRIWFNLDLQRSGGPNWSRIGSRIE